MLNCLLQPALLPEKEHTDQGQPIYSDPFFHWVSDGICEDPILVNGEIQATKVGHIPNGADRIKQASGKGSICCTAECSVLFYSLFF